VQNLKAVANTYAASGTIAELQEKIAERKSLAKTSKESLVALEKKMKPAADIIMQWKSQKILTAITAATMQKSICSTQQNMR
jgi:hypothetical protein